MSRITSTVLILVPTACLLLAVTLRMVGGPGPTAAQAAEELRGPGLVPVRPDIQPGEKQPPAARETPGAKPDAAKRVGEGLSEAPSPTGAGNPPAQEKAEAKPQSKSESAPDRPTGPGKPKVELTPPMAALRDRVRQTLLAYYRQVFNTRANTATDIIHFCLAFGCSTEVHAGSEQKINGITCLCWNYPCAGYEPLAICDGRINARIGYGAQEHPAQLLAMLATSYVPNDYPIRVGQTVRTVADLVESERLSCRSGTDLSLKLVGLAHYADGPAWKNDLGEEWSIERIIKEEIDQPIATAVCGGMNRLMGLSYAVNRRLRRQKPLEGEFLRAQKLVKDFQEFALSHQGADGSWGPRVFAGAETSRAPAVPIRATAYVLEWLLTSLPESQLQEPRVVRSVEYVIGMLNSSRYRWNVASLSGREIGSVMHALHALVVYDQRVFQPADPPKPES